MNNDYLIQRVSNKFYDEYDNDYSGVTMAASLPRYQQNVTTYDELVDAAYDAGMPVSSMMGTLLPTQELTEDDGKPVAWGNGWSIPKISNSLVAQATRPPGEHISDYDIDDFESLEQLGFPNYMFIDNTKEINLNQYTVFSKSSDGKPRYIKLNNNTGAAYWQLRKADGSQGRLSVRQLNHLLMHGEKADGRLGDFYEDCFEVYPYRTLPSGEQVKLKGNGGYRAWLKENGLEDED